MAQSDLEINRNVRRVFVRHWLDLGRLFIRSANSRVSVRGTLSRINGMNDPITATTVDAIFTEVKRIKNVKAVAADLDNWSNDRGVWKPKGDHEKSSQAKSTPMQADGQKTYVIGKSKEP